MAHNLTALSNALGAYHRVNSKEVIQKRIYMPGRTNGQEPVTLWDGIRRRFFRDEQSYAHVKMNLQARARTPNVVVQSDAAIVHDGAIRKLRDIETILNITPEDLENTWYEEQMEKQHKFEDQPTLRDTKFVPWLYQYMLDSWLSNLYTISCITGDYNAAAAYADSWPAVMDGLLTLVTDEIAALNGNINVVATGVISAANAYEKLESIGQALPLPLRYTTVKLYCSDQIADWYNADRATTFPGDNGVLHPTYKQFTLRNRRNVVIVPVPEFASSQRVIITPDMNISFNSDFRGKGPQLAFTPINVKQIQTLIQMSAGMSVDDWSDVVVNDQA